MESTIQLSHPIDSVSRKRAREEEELSADIPPQKRSRSQDAAPLESTGIAVADSDQPQLTLLPPPESRSRYEIPSPESIPATLPTSDAPARNKRRRDESEIDTAAPSKRRNVAQGAVQTLPAHEPHSTARCTELIEDAMVAEPTRDAPDGGQTLVHSSSPPPSSVSWPPVLTLKPKASMPKAKAAIPKAWRPESDPPMRYSTSDRCYIRLNALPSSPLGPHFVKRNLKRAKLAGKGSKKVCKPSSSDRRISLLKRRAICVQQDTKQWYPRGFPQMRIPSVKLPASAKRKWKPPPSDPGPPTPTPPPQPTFFPASTGELFQAGTHYTSASSSIQLDADLEVPASWEQRQWVYCGDHGGYWVDYSTAMRPSASLHNTSWYTGPQQNEQTLFDDSSSEHTPLGSVSEISRIDHQFNDSLDFDLDSPLLFEPVQPVQVLLSYPSLPSIPPHSLSKDSELSPMHGYVGGMQGQVEPVVYLDEDVVETV